MIRSSLSVVSLLSIVLCIGGGGCKRNRKYGKYEGRVFNVTILSYDDKDTRTWHNASGLTHHREEDVYTFYVGGKLVQVDSVALVMSEVGVPESLISVHPEHMQYPGKRYDITVSRGNGEQQSWKNVVIKSLELAEGAVAFVADGRSVFLALPRKTELLVSERKP